ncbi:hypothetical protein [Nocardia sp. CA-120079]|uniref:hypothetical protein n=1 Tax=Nocardia sp. CA-120079 TaxID=3239974 RepID=UPI003D955E70
MSSDDIDDEIDGVFELAIAVQRASWGAARVTCGSPDASSACRRSAIPSASLMPNV